MTPETPPLPPVPASRPPLAPHEVRRRRLLYRATHRGTHENDLLIGGYVGRHIATMDEAAMDALEAVMALPDPDLADWLSGRLPIPPEHDGPLLRAMRAEAGRPA